MGAVPTIQMKGPPGLVVINRNDLVDYYGRGYEANDPADLTPAEVETLGLNASEGEDPDPVEDEDDDGDTDEGEDPDDED